MYKLIMESWRRFVNESVEDRRDYGQAMPLDDLLMKLAFKVPQVLPPEEVRDMSDDQLGDLMVDLYSRHFDPTGEGWEPYPEDIQAVRDKLLPPDDDEGDPGPDEFFENKS